MKKLMDLATEMNAVEEAVQHVAGRKEQIRYKLGATLELTGTSYFPERLNDAGKTVPAVYSGWCDDELFRLLGESADALNEVAPAWKQNNIPSIERGGQIVVLGTVEGKTCRFQEPKDDEDFMPSFRLHAGHLNGEVDVIGPKAVKFTRKAANG